ncbi:cytidine deaminase-like protein [Aspergillus leporis]|jgi:pyrimidine deaminase RibD-like protein|uniref:Cytidine deaminase-like protein n=1 Tax=Aspergillus leporis TaxID=41062 RepID=A0A5N5X7G1_9EURO|nr:cytidine deaminase-like protein [Aspergillus leporis]
MQSPHVRYLQECLKLAQKSPALPTNFRVGAILVLRKEGDYKMKHDRIVSTGYTMELEGNTHAEQCCLAKWAAVRSVPEERVWEVLPTEPGRKLVLYVTMEPCGKRLSGNIPCVQRIIQTRQGDQKGIQKVYFGVKEPGTFVGGSEGCKMLTSAGIEWQVVNGLEKDILEVATAGHENREEEINAALDSVETNIDGISDGERRRQQEMKRNPKKKTVEADLLS